MTKTNINANFVRLAAAALLLSGLCAAAFSETLNVKWVRRTGDLTVDKMSVAMKSASDIVSFDSTGAMLRKYNTAGTLIWEKNMQTPDVKGKDVTINKTTGDIFVTGVVISSEIVVVEKYDSSGVFQWVTELGYGDVLLYDEDYHIECDDSGNSYVTGYIRPPQKTFGTYLVRVGTSSQVEWSVSIPSITRDMVADEDGNLYFCGETYIGFDSHTVTAVPNAGGDGYVVKYSTAGERLWSVFYGTEYTETVYGIALAGDGIIYVIGISLGNLDGNVHVGNTDVFMGKIGPGGAKLWTKLYGTYNDEYASDIVLDAAGNPVAAMMLKRAGSSNEIIMVMEFAGYDANGNLSWVSDICNGEGLTMNEVVSYGPEFYAVGNYGGSFNVSTSQGAGNDYVIALALEDQGTAYFEPSNVKVYHGIFKPGRSETCQVNYTLNDSVDVNIDVYNSLGVKVRNIYNGRGNTGINSVAWDGKNDNGENVPSGVYVIRIDPGAALKRVVVIR